MARMAPTGSTHHMIGSREGAVNVKAGAVCASLRALARGALDPTERTWFQDAAAPCCLLLRLFAGCC